MARVGHRRVSRAGEVARRRRGLLGFERVSRFRDGLVDIGITEVFTFDGHMAVVENSDVLYSACLRYRVFDGGGSFVGAHAGDGVILHHGGYLLVGYCRVDGHRWLVGASWCLTGECVLHGLSRGAHNSPVWNETLVIVVNLH